jgi:hypothetical protein
LLRLILGEVEEHGGGEHASDPHPHHHHHHH